MRLLLIILMGVGIVLGTLLIIQMLRVLGSNRAARNEKRIRDTTPPN